MERLVFFIFFVFFSSSQSICSDSVYNFVSIMGLPEQGISARIVEEIFTRAGFDIEIKDYPGERARLLSSSGLRDGEICRIYSFGEFNPTLVRVNIPYSSVNTTAFVNSMSDLESGVFSSLHDYRVAILRGVQTTYDLTKEYENVIVMDSLESMFKFLHYGRADIVLTSEIAGLSIIQKLNLQWIEPIGIVSSEPLYIYFHEKHKEVVPEIEKVISSMKSRRELSALREKFEIEYLSSLDLVESALQSSLSNNRSDME